MGIQRMRPELVIIGGGLAGSEAAWQVARRGIKVRLYEMRPRKMTEAHESEDLAELVCSNSFKSIEITNAHGLLKEELRMLGSLIMEVAEKTRVPAGSSLSVDRKEFSRMVTEAIQSHPLIEVIREEIGEPGWDCPTIIATGPLTSQGLSEWLKTITGCALIYFYDAISPIVLGDSINHEKVFRASRYQKGGTDYINCSMSREEYESFYKMLISAEMVPLREFENIPYFEGCMPVEVLASRGFNTLLFGPMKPVGLISPLTGEQPFAVVQLRQEDRYGQAYNMVGFQTRLKWPEQRRVFRMIPGLEEAEFLRYGSIHRNTYINSPALLDESLRLKNRDNVYMAGQITGVEGYGESTAMGLLAGISVSLHLQGKEYIPPPPCTAIGALMQYILQENRSSFQPMNINWGLLPPLNIARKDRLRYRKMLAMRAIEELERWKKSISL